MRSGLLQRFWPYAVPIVVIAICAALAISVRPASAQSDGASSGEAAAAAASSAGTTDEQLPAAASANHIWVVVPIGPPPVTSSADASESDSPDSDAEPPGGESDRTAPPQPKAPSPRPPTSGRSASQSAVTFALVHIALRENPEHYAQTLTTLPRAPEAMAAFGDDLWLAFAPQPTNGSPLREVYRVQARRHPLHGGYYLVPHGRLEPMPALPAVGRMAGFVGSARGPVALLAPRPAHLAATEIDPDDIPDDALLEPRLLRLNHTGWRDEPLPESLDAESELDLAVLDDGRTLWLVESDTTGPVRAPARIHEWRIARPAVSEPAPDDEPAEPDDGELPGDNRVQSPQDGAESPQPDQPGWTTTLAPPGLERIISVAGLDPDAMAVLAASRDELAIARFTQSRFLPLTTITLPPFAWTVQPGPSGAWIIFGPDDQNLSLLKVDGFTGEVSDRIALGEQPVDVTQLLRVPVMLAIAAFAIVMAAILRPASREEIVWGPGERPAPLFDRSLALLLDLLPGAIVALLVLHRPAIELLGLPLMTLRFEDSLPYIYMACVSAVIATGSELIWGRSLGKSLLGLDIRSERGGRPPRIALLVRGVVRLLGVLVPALLVFALFSPNLQALHDLLARTVVVRLPREDDEAGDSTPPTSPNDPGGGGSS